jgi:hypothetical protein
MRYISRYKTFEKADTDLIGDALLDLTDDGFKYKIQERNKIGGTFGKNVEGRMGIDVIITRSPEFTYNDIKDTVGRLSGYMDSEGYIFSVQKCFRQHLHTEETCVKDDDKINRVILYYRPSTLALLRAKSKYKI